MTNMLSTERQIESYGSYSLDMLTRTKTLVSYYCSFFLHLHFTR